MKRSVIRATRKSGNDEMTKKRIFIICISVMISMTIFNAHAATSPKKGIIIGFGNMGRNHFERYKKLGINIIAVVDIDDTALKVANDLGLQTCKKIEDCHNIEQADFIDISTPTYLHYPFLELAIQKYKKHIFVEKPVVLTAEEADKLAALTKNYSPIIFVGEVEHYNHRLTNFLYNARNAQSIKISRSVNLEYFLHGKRPWFLDPKLSGGLILDLMVHDLSELDSAFGEATILDGAFKQKKYNCIDEATVKLSYKQAHVNAEVTGSWISDNSQHPIILTAEITERNGHVKKLVIDDYAVRGKVLDENDAYLNEIRAFNQAVNTGKAPHPLGEYLRVVKLANSIMLLSRARQQAS